MFLRPIEIAWVFESILDIVRKNNLSPQRRYRWTKMKRTREVAWMPLSLPKQWNEMTNEEKQEGSGMDRVDWQRYGEMLRESSPGAIPRGKSPPGE